MFWFGFGILFVLHTKVLYKFKAVISPCLSVCFLPFLQWSLLVWPFCSLWEHSMFTPTYGSLFMFIYLPRPASPHKLFSYVNARTQ